MNFSVNGQSQVPPGFRFHPTEEELLHFYLRKKISQECVNLDVIPYVDLNKLEPWDIQEMCKIGSGPQNEWYFFSHKDKKYPTGTRTNRATEAGFWKATGRDKVVYNNVGRIGLRKTLVFYIGRAPCGQKSDWIMYEYRLDENANDTNDSNLVESKADEGWVVCRLFKKRNHFKGRESPSTFANVGARFQTSSKDNDNNENDGDLHQIVRCIVKPCKQELETTSNDSDNNNNDVPFEGSIDSTTGGGLFDKLFATHNDLEAPIFDLSVDEMLKGFEEEFEKELMAYKLNGQVTMTQRQVLGSENLGFLIPCLSSDEEYSQVHTSSEIDAWGFS